MSTRDQSELEQMRCMGLQETLIVIQFYLLRTTYSCYKRTLGREARLEIVKIGEETGHRFD